MAMTATIVVVASVAVERSGPFIGALIAALPTAAGAAYILLAIEHPPAFIAASAVGSLAANAAVAVFALTYAVLAQRHGVLPSIAVAVGMVRRRSRIAAGRLDADERGRAQCGRLRRHRSGERPLSCDGGAAAGNQAHPLRHPVARADRGVGGRGGDDRQSPHRLVRLRHVRGVSGGDGKLRRDPASAGRRRRPPSVLAHAQVPLVGLGSRFSGGALSRAERSGSWRALAAGLAISIAWNAMLWLARHVRARTA